MLQVWDIEQTLWKDAAKHINSRGKFSKANLEKIWNTFDLMNKFLNSCKNLINQALKQIKYMEEKFELKQTDENSYMEHYNELIVSFNQSLEDVDKSVKEIAEYFPSADDLLDIFIDFSKDLDLINKTECKKFLTELENDF